MNTKRLFKEIGFIDDDLIMEADTIKRAKSFHLPWKRLGLVACFLGAVFIIGILPQLTVKKGTVDPNIKKPSPIISKTEGDGLIFNKVQNLPDYNIYIPGHFWEELNDDEMKAILPGIEDVNKFKGTANFQGDGSLFNIDIYTKLKSDTKLYIQIAPGNTILDYSFDTEPKESLIKDISVLAGYYEGDHDNVYFANFKLGNLAYYLEFHLDNKDKSLIENSKKMFTELISSIIAGGEGDISIFKPVIPELRDDKLTLEEAYKDKDFGKYLPDDPPKGFTFEGSNRFINQANNFLSAFWSKGLNNMSWRISKFYSTDRERLTSIKDKKNYDMALYPIPMADSVPKELGNIVDNPIFHIGELTLETVEARMVRLNDKGDEAGYHLRFSVLYHKEILVEINTKGVEGEYIFDQLIGINH